MNAVLENILTRRSYRAFTEQKIAKEDLELIAKAGQYAPSAMNRQTFQITVITNEEIIKKLYTAIPKYMDGIDASKYNFYGSKHLMLVSDLASSEIGQMDCACVAENIFLAANSLGIGSVWVNQLRNTSDGEEVRAALTEAGVPADHRVWVICALGYPVEKITDKEKVAKIHFCE